MHFIDEVKIHIKSGDGGPGCVSFRREKFIEYGGPDGGNGGRGGDVVIRATQHLNTLIDFRFKQHFKAQNGEHGMGKNRVGKSRDPIVLIVPIGTQVFDEFSEEVLFDLTEHGQEIVLAKGGDGGLGNNHFKSSTNQAPEKATKGWPGEQKVLWLKLKLISDVGLVGLPNAGKSSLLSRVSRARPKIADYPFTTLEPHLGVVFVDQSEFVVADIPGLIEGAHEGIGLGDKFLKHIERCKVLLHLIDINSEDVIKDYQVIRNELESYSDKLTNKLEIIALNKIDSVTEDEKTLKENQLMEFTNKDVMLVSAVTGENITELIRKLNIIVKEN